MTQPQIEALLQPGDCLLYRPKGVFGFFIRVKTWHHIAHCEMYVGKGKAAASREGKGVAIYPLRVSELAYVLRPDLNILDWAGFW